MTMNRGSRYAKIRAKLIITVIPLTLLLLALFFMLTRSKILELSQNNLVQKSRTRRTEIEAWAKQVLKELSIYKDIADEMGIENERTFDIFRCSCGRHESYPYGLYWGDIDGNYFDASGWVPDEDYVPAEREWYIEGLNHREFAFGVPYVDAMTGDTCVSVTVRTGTGADESVLSADVYLDYASRLVQQMTEEDVAIAFFASEEKLIIASSDQTMVGVSLGDGELSRLYANIGKMLAEGKRGINTVRGEGSAYFVNIDVVENTRWYFITCTKQKDVLRDLRQVEIPMLLISIMGAALIIVVTINVSNELSTVSRKARTDPLTKVLNRDGFREMVTMGMEAHPNQGVMLILDMDNFKQVNDQLGHPEGDAVLKRFAALLEEYFNRNKDITGRIGGDEFAVFVGRVITEQEIETMLTKFLELFHATFDGQYAAQKLSVSIGAAFDADDIKFDELYRKADRALYRVKENGKNGFAY